VVEHASACWPLEAQAFSQTPPQRLRPSNRYHLISGTLEGLKNIYGEVLNGVLCSGHFCTSQGDRGFGSWCRSPILPCNFTILNLRLQKTIHTP